MTTPSTSPHFDLTSFLNLQKNYTADLNGSSQTGAITSLSNNLKQIFDNSQASQIGANATILKQNEVNSILESENQRLLDKKQNIDTAIQGQKRMIKINENYQMRYAAYTRMLMVFVLMVFLCIVVKIMAKYVTIIPEAVYILFYIIIITVCLVIIFIQFLSLKSRDPADYNTIMMSPPLNVGGSPTATNQSGVSSDYTNQFGDYYNCVGQNCCAKGIKWSPLTGCALTPSPAPV
jgi:hypothetical protein